MISRSSQSQPYVVERRIAFLPTRSAQAAGTRVTDLILAVLQARRASRLPELRLTLIRLQPLLHCLLVTHDLEQGAVEFATHDMRISFTFMYETQGDAKETPLPPLEELLEPLLPETILTLSLLLPHRLANTSLTTLVEAINAAGVLTVRLLDAEATAQETENAPPDDRDGAGKEEDRTVQETEPEANASLPAETTQDEMTSAEESGLTRKTEGESEWR